MGIQLSREGVEAKVTIEEDDTISKTLKTQFSSRCWFGD